MGPNPIGAIVVSLAVAGAGFPEAPAGSVASAAPEVQREHAKVKPRGPCKLGQARPCVRLKRSDKSGGAWTPKKGKDPQKGTARGRNVFWRAGDQNAGRPVYLRLVANKALGGGWVRISIPALPGLSRDDISLLRPKGLDCGQAELDRKNKRFTVDCKRRKQRKRNASIVVCVQLDEAARGKTLSVKARRLGPKQRTGSRGEVGGFDKVNVGIRKPLGAPGPGPAAPKPPKPAFRPGIASDCPAGDGAPREVTVFGRAGTVTSVLFDDVDKAGRDRQGRIVSVICFYDTTPAGAFKIVINWTYGDEDSTAQAGACANPRGEPAFDGRHAWFSTKRQLEVRWEGSGNLVLIDPAEATVMTTLIKKLESKQVGAPCE